MRAKNRRVVAYSVAYSVMHLDWSVYRRFVTQVPELIARAQK